MGEKTFYQPLTKEDKITVILYRAGILLSTIIVCLAAFLAARGTFLGATLPVSNLDLGIMLLLFYFSIGLSVFFIHLYVGKFHRFLKKLYYAAVLCLILLFLFGRGDPVAAFLDAQRQRALLLIPIALCLGFITAKEAFCFRLIEGYLLAAIMPAYLFFYAVGALNERTAVAGLCLIAALLLLFTFRKIFMPVHYDIGDKSAYQP